MALRTPLSVTPHLYMGDSTGRPLDNGVVYFGEQDKDPEFYPITLYSDDALTKPLMQPVHTKGGYLYDKGDMVEPHAKEIIYSVKVLDSYGRKVFYKGAMMRNSWNDDVIAQINQAIIDSQQDVAAEAAKAVQVAIDATAVEGGVLADTFVTATAKAPAMIARTQKQVNAQTITPYDFGLVGGFSTLTLGDKFDTLAEAQAAYPNAVALTELHDRVAFDRFLMYLIDNRVEGVDVSCELLLDKPLKSYINAKTLLWSGRLVLESHTTDISHALHISTPYMVHTGMVVVNGTTREWSDMRTRLIRHGVIFGAYPPLGLTGDGPNINFNHIEGNTLLGHAFLLGANCHFTRVATVTGRNCGSGQTHNQYPLLQGVGDTFTSVVNSGNDTSQRSVLSIPDMKLTARMYDYKQNKVVIDSKPYDVISVDFVAKTIELYPQLPTGVTTGDLLHVFGSAACIYSNNTACSTIGILQGIVCGYVYCAPSLYGCAIDSMVSENCGIAVCIAGFNDAHLGTSISLGYFEANHVDIVYGWANSQFGSLTIVETIALNVNKVFNLYGYTNGAVRRADRSAMGAGQIGYNGRTLELDGYMYNITSPTKNVLYWDKSYSTPNTDIQISCNAKIAELTRAYDKVLFFVPYSLDSAHTVTLLAPEGYTINDAASIVVRFADYTGVVSVYFSAPPGSTERNILAMVDGVRKVKKGTQYERPINVIVGDMFYDTSLLPSGKPISWNGTEWVDSTGTTV